MIECVRHFRQLRALVIGDAMLDTYFEGTASRLCSEGPVPVVSKTAEHRIPGGAANTAANLRALDANVIFLGIVGRDVSGSLLRTALRECGVADSWLVEDESASTLHKLRILADGQYVVRFDEGGPDGHAKSGTIVGGQVAYTEACQRELLARLEEAYEQCDLVLISDYGYGVASPQLIERLQMLHAAHPKVLLVDSKALHHFQNLKATIVTPNYLEARLLVERMEAQAHRELLQSTVTLAEVERIGWQVVALLDTEHVAITLAEHGVFLLDRQGNATYLPAHPVAHANDVGAGDSFAAALALALAAGSSVEEATQIGIDAASIAITKQWTAVVHYQELLQRVSLRAYATSTPARVHDNDVHESWSRLAALLNEERLAGRTIVFTNGVFDILHAGHIQFLRQARALGDVLVVGVNSDSCTRRLKGVGRPINSERDRIALVAALDVVDHVVLFNDDTPSELIRVLKPHIHVKGGDYADEALPEAEAVREVGGRVVILPLAGSMSTTSMIDRIVSLASDRGDMVAASREEER
ncbi:MAG: D-glycero-beta-D-manno-heptose 1-phosphate adenylyltransferase [Chloroflexi bacterium]|nr:D-glycero-beta-D-manno-heptose 1-phosphate adenylyltransferase [Chloroflexota bacterium]